MDESSIDSSLKYYPVTMGMTDRYKMSLDKALKLPYPCGKNQGKPMQDIHVRNLHWLGNLTTTMKNKPEFRMAVKAARIVIAYRKEKKDADKAKSAATGKDIRTDAKKANVECLRCGKKAHVPRHWLRRAKGLKCLECGGTMNESESVIDEWLSVRESADFTGMSQQTLRDAADRNDIVHRKNSRGHCELGMSSVQKFALVARENAHLTSLGIRNTRTDICELCGKRFRNPAAYRMHMMDSHGYDLG